MSTASTAPAKTGAGSAAGPRCHVHAAQPAVRQCTNCGQAFCEACMRERTEARAHAESCPSCRGFCRSLEASGPQRPRSMAEMVSDAIAYPLRGSGFGLILLGAVFFVLIDMLSRSWRYGLFFSIFGAGYLSAYMLETVNGGANGKKEPQDWPEFANVWDSVALPFLQMATVWLVCLAPAALPFLVSGITQGSVFAASAIAIVTSLYVPMAILALALNNSVAAIGPSVVVPAILAVPWQYLAVWGVLAAAGALSALFQAFVASAIPILGLAVNTLVSLYLLSVEMRLVGLLYLVNSKRLKLV